MAPNARLALMSLAGIAGGIYMSLLGSLPTAADFSQAGSVLSATLVILLVSGWALLRHLPKSTRLFQSGIFLGTRTDRAIGYESSERRTDLVGAAGVAATGLRPSGVGIFDDARVDIVSQSEWIQEGTPVRVVSAEGYRRVVRPIRNKGEDPEPATSPHPGKETQGSSEQEPSDQAPPEVADV